MATIVTNTEVGGRFVLLGGGYTSDRIERPHFLLGNMAPNLDHTEHSLALVSNSDGKIGWMEVEHLRVVSIDGVSPRDALSPQDNVRE